MSEQSPFRRVLLALETPGQDEAFLRASAELAARLGVELSGLLVEDEDLLRMGALPAARQFDPLKGSLQPFVPGSVEREMRAQLGETRELLSRVCAQLGIPLSLRSVRGHAGVALEEASEETDLLIIAGTARPLARRLEFRSRTWSAALHSRRTVLVLQHGGISTTDWLVPYDGSQASKRALALALRLAGRDGREITAVLLGGESARLREEVRAALPASGVAVQFYGVEPPTPEALASFLRRSGRGTLVLGADWGLLEDGGTERLVAAAPGAVLLVRGA